MVYSPRDNKEIQRLSLLSVKGIVLILFAGIALAFLVLWRPTYLHLHTLQTERSHWQNVLQEGLENSQVDTMATFPTMDQLPDMIEHCRSRFVEEGVEVLALNVERFGERRETGKGASLDYGLVRLRLRGPREGIISSIKAIEETQEISIHVQEVVLNQEGGEVLLQIDFCTGV